MSQWISQFKNASAQTKYFILTWAIFGLALVVTTIYCYVRLDYPHSNHIEKAAHHNS